MAKRILVVEDDDMVADFTSQVLRKLDYLVVGISNTGEMAVIKARESTPDLVLMDIELKGSMDGIEAARQIYYELEIPAVFLTGFEDEDTFHRAQAAMPFGYINKPFAEKEMGHVIEIAFAQHEARRRGREAEKRFRDLLHEAVLGIFRANPKGEFLLRNPILLRLLGYKSYDELSAKIRSIDDALPLKPAHIKGLEPLVIDARVPRSFELQSYRLDGSTIWVSGKTRLVHDANGEVCYEGSLMGGFEQEGSSR